MTAFLPERHVSADNAECGRLLGEILTLFRKHGGAVHPCAVWRETNGHMSVTCDSGAAGYERPLVELPRELLVPVTGAEWADSKERLILRRPPPGITPLQRALLDLHVDLYNATGKVPWTISHHPRAVVPGHAPLLDALRDLRPGIYPKSDMPAEIFLHTRVFGPKSPPDPVLATPIKPAAKTQVLMPLIDTLNHHPQGAPFQLDETGLRVRLAQPSGTAECFAAYGGRRDVLDLALHYGYVDEATPFAFSAPVNVEVPGLGWVAVGANRIRPAHPLDPPRVSWDGETLDISHLCCHRQHPERLRTALRLPVLAVARKCGLADDAANYQIDGAMAALAEANLSLLTKLQQATRNCLGHSPVADLLLRAADRQGEIIQAVMMPAAYGQQECKFDPLGARHE
jgi:hypothetical protein